MGNVHIEEVKMAYIKATDAELEILRELWQANAPRAVSEIRSALADKHGWKATTVKTLLYNLRDKGAVEEVRRGVYRSVITEDEVTREASREFVRKMFEGSAKKLVASLLDSGELTESELADLRGRLSKEEGDD